MRQVIFDTISQTLTAYVFVSTSLDGSNDISDDANGPDYEPVPAQRQSIKETLKKSFATRG